MIRFKCVELVQLFILESLSQSQQAYFYNYSTVGAALFGQDSGISVLPVPVPGQHNIIFLKFKNTWFKQKLTK